MKSKVDSPLTLRRDRRSIEACGPLKPPEAEWAPGETEVSIVVTITQNGNQAVGLGKSPPVFPKDDDDEWMLNCVEVRGKRFEPGPAQAFAVAIGNGSQGPVSWGPVGVTLE